MDVLVPMNPFNRSSKLIKEVSNKLAIPVLECAFSMWRDSLLQTFIRDSRLLTCPELRVMHWILDISDDNDDWSIKFTTYSLKTDDGVNEVETCTIMVMNLLFTS